MFTVRIGTWVNGAPTEVKRFSVASKEEGLEALRNIGHSWVYNINYAGYLYEGDKLLAILNIYQHTYGVKEVTN
jgi:hypothetical protein